MIPDEKNGACAFETRQSLQVCENMKRCNSYASLQNEMPEKNAIDGNSETFEMTFGSPFRHKLKQVACSSVEVPPELTIGGS